MPIDGQSTGDRRRLRSGPHPGGGAGHLPGRQLDPHQPVGVRADEHGLRVAVPAPGGRGDLGGAGRGAAHAEGRRQARVPGGPRGRPRGHDAAGHQPVRHRVGRAAVPDPALATTCLGIGFGLAVPALNNLAAAFFPAAADRAVLYLNALLGLGTALAPVLVAVFLGLGAWWGLPLLVAALTAGLLVVASGLPLTVDSRARADRAHETAGAAAGVPAVRRASRSCTGSSRRPAATGRRCT